MSLNENRLRTRRIRGRHTPYTNLWERGPSPARHETLLRATELADFAPRPGPSADNNIPIVIDDEVKILWCSFATNTFFL